MNTPHLIEIALLMLAAFLIGCLIGYFLRRMVGGEASTPIAPESAQKTSTSAATAPSSVATTSEKAPEKTQAPADKKPAEKKPTAKKAAPAKAAAAKTSTAKAKSAPAKAAPAKTAAKKPPAKKPAGSPDGKPETLAAPRGGAKDDLKHIKGIGPKIEETLNAMGIYHHDQIAAWGRKEVKWVDEELSFKGRIDREKWIAQAKTLAKAK